MGKRLPLPMLVYKISWKSIRSFPRGIPESCLSSTSGRQPLVVRSGHDMMIDDNFEFRVPLRVAYGETSFRRVVARTEV